MPYTIPNEADAGTTDQASPDKVDLDILTVGLSHGTGSAGSYGVGPTGVQSGCAVTAQGTPDMTVAVAAGIVRIGGRRVTVASGNVTITTAHGTNKRRDLIVVDTAGAKTAIAGTASDPTRAALPTITSGKVVLAAVTIPAADTTIGSNQITDKRVMIPEPPHEDVTWYGAVGDDSTNNATALQLAIDTAADVGAGIGRGRTVFFPHGIYRTASTIIMPTGVKLLGDGRPGSNSIYGSWISGTVNGMTIIDDPDAGASNQDGWAIEKLGFVDGGGATGITGLHVSGTDQWRVDDCVFFSNVDGSIATGISLEAGTAGNLDNNYSAIAFTEFRRVLVGVDGFVAPHMLFCDYRPGATMTSGAIAVRMKASGTDTALHAQNGRFVGCEFLVPSNGIGVHSQGSFIELTSCHFEAITSSTGTTGLKLEKVAGSNTQSGTRHNLGLCSFVKFTTAIEIGTNVTDTAIIGVQHATNTTNLTDNGTRTLYLPNTSGEIARLAVALDWPSVTAPASPASGFSRMYVDIADAILKSKDSAGIVSVYGARSRSLFIDASMLRLDAAQGVKIGTPPNAVDAVSLADGVTSGAYCNFNMPVDVITGTVKIRPQWAPGTTDGVAHTVRWQRNIKIITAADVTASGESIAWTGDSAARTVNVEVLETGGTTTITPAANDRIRLEIQRLGADGADTYVGAVQLLGIRIDYQANN
jgi:hypothetical protein